jgi:cytochrome P450
MAGIDTTTQTLAFTFYQLARNPQVQDTLRAELEALGREPTYDDIHSGLPYLDAILKEA